ncbi:type III pantothenate kinase [Candidatus Pseudothioglobus sp. Uisw_041]|jgi:type III pantothenate kinase|uniref:type III pantothenate kinase n=1 Tax=Candidatus Pseudothioglobus sp. Uisw_041 TaxID=3230996 RepID=UPI003A873B20
MSQSSLFIDIGNSAVKWRTCDPEVFTEGVDLFSLELLPKADSVWVSAVAHLSIIAEIKANFGSVNLVEPLRQHGKLTLSYDDPSNFGVDRFLAMLAALERFPNAPLLVIDAGSAVTFDIIDNKGIHQGGLIMPGIKALRESFAKFSTNDLSINTSELKNNTEGSWQSGTHAMLVSAVNSQIHNFELKYPDGVITICGGIIKEIIKELPMSVKSYDNLVLDGLESYSQSMG